MQLSIVARMYGCAAAIRQFHRQVRVASSEIAEDIEIILVNDDSPDDSLEVARGLVAEDPSVRVIDLSRTFGHDKAVLTGLAHSTGELVFIADLTFAESADCLPVFYREMQNSRADSVYEADLRAGNRLMTRTFLNSLLRLRDREVYLAGLYALVGYRQIGVAVPKSSVRGSRFHQRIAEFKALATFNTLPLIFIFYIGTAILILSLIAALGLTIDRLFFQTFLPGWPSLVVSIWVLGGLVLFSLGVTALYLSKIFLETKNRPDTIVSEVLRPGARAE